MMELPSVNILDEHSITSSLQLRTEKLSNKRKRDKLGHSHFASEPHAQELHGANAKGHGFDAASQSKHQRMALAITDCEVLMARGMGAGAYESLHSANIQPIITDKENIDDAVRAYLEGNLTDHTELLH